VPGLPVKSHCFPFRQVPHTTRLFLDYLEHVPEVEPFYPRSAKFLEWAQQESSRVNYPAERRSQVADILERQNTGFGASTKTLENIAAFRAGALALVTGQQVGLFGGPAFSLYKALSAVKLAQEAQNLGISCVPIFWLATEDHDLEEVNQIRLIGADGQLESFASAARGAEDAPVATIQLGPEILQLLEHAQQLLGDSEAGKLLAECYRPGESLGTAFAKLFARLFAEFGVIVLDGSDPALDAIAAPLYRVAIERATELNQVLLQRDRELQAAQYHQQVKITSSTTPLFLINEGARVPLHITATGNFSAGKRELSRDELLEVADSAPQSLSPNVLLRPVVQDYLLPTLAYVGGAAEVAYFAQVGALYQTLSGRVTPILPRFSATLIESKPQAILEHFKLAFTDLFRGPEALSETIGSRMLDQNLQSSFDQAGTAVERSMAAIREALGRLDKTLIESATNAESKMMHQIEALRSRAARAELRQSEVAERKARLLSNALYPDKTLQEREVAGISLVAKHGMELLDGLLEMIHPDCVDHQLINL
jgi:bacillithiol biosynthesis cysteine-adding enzyme BshC